MKGAGAHLHVVGLQDHAALGGPVALQRQDQVLEGGGGWPILRVHGRGRLGRSLIEKAREYSRQARGLASAAARTTMVRSAACASEVRIVDLAPLNSGARTAHGCTIMARDGCRQLLSR